MALSKDRSGEGFVKRVPVTADTISELQILTVKHALVGIQRKNSYHRAIIKDCDVALKGSRCCRESAADAYNKMLGESPPVGDLTAETVSDMQILDLLNALLNDALAHVHRVLDIRLCQIALGHIRKGKAERAAARAHCAELLNSEAS